MRIFHFVLDSLGIGNAPDADKFGDKGADTLGHIADRVDDFHLPNFEFIGLGYLKDHPKIQKYPGCGCRVAKMIELSGSKDTSAGHWEMMGVKVDTAFAHYDKNGFPSEIMDEFEKITDRGWMGNYAASGTEIIEKLGDEHVKTGKFIVYTSADSVFQIAAHADTVPLEELYEVCEKTRVFLDKYKVLRVIARPFEGTSGNYSRLNSKRHDYSMKPVGRTYLEDFQDAGIKVIGVGKIPDIFAHIGIDEKIHTDNNLDGMKKNLELLENTSDRSFIFTNLVEFDAVYGHRRDPQGYYRALQDFDKYLPEFINKMNEDDYLFLTADHGCDPTFKGSDHTREMVPLIIYSNSLRSFEDLGTVEGFMTVGNKIKEIFGI